MPSLVGQIQANSQKADLRYRRQELRQQLLRLHSQAELFLKCPEHAW
jgi:hypothetical protein